MANDPQDRPVQDEPEVPGDAPSAEEGFDAPDAGYQADDAQDAVLNPVTRVFAVLRNPGDAMRGVHLKGGWLMPFLLLVVCVVIFATMAGDTLTEFSIHQMEERFQDMVESGQMSQEQADQIFEQQSNSGIIRMTLYVTPIIGSLLIKLVMAALLLLAGNIFLGGKEAFRRYWSLAWYAGVIGAIHVAIYGILVGLTNDPHGGYLGLAVLTKADPSGVAHKLAQVVNVFLIWEAIVAGIGLSVFAKRSTTQGIIWGLIVYVGIGIISSLLFGQPMI